MRKEQLLNKDWRFIYHDGTVQNVDIPHTWNNLDGQDGGNDYYRGTCVYEKNFPMPVFASDERVYLQFDGSNSSTKVVLNGQVVMTHDGGYSTFRTDVTDFLKPENELHVEVDNSVNDRVYPQKADFTFYGGIYRDVKLVTVNQYHFDMDYHSGPGIAVSPEVRGEDAAIWVRTWHNAENGAVSILLKDAEGNVVGTGADTDETIVIQKAHLWHGIEDPYLYTCEAALSVDGRVVDTVSTHFGVRSFRVDSTRASSSTAKNTPSGVSAAIRTGKASATPSPKSITTLTWT